MNYKPNREKFLKDVKDHEIIIHQDNGLYRHFTLKRPKETYGSFSIITWPGYLSYSGDMGDFTFSRLEDMFKFFRRPENLSGEINPDYWSQKLQAVDRFGGYEEFSLSRLEECIKEDFSYWEHENREQRHGDWEDIEEELLHGFDSQESALNAVCNYESPFGKKHFTDFWEHNLTEYTYRFIFCCHAIPWAIGKYDEYKLTQAHSLHS